MTAKHRKLCLFYLNCWGLLERCSDSKEQRWLLAIQKTEAYYLTREGAISAIVFDLHFRRKLSRSKTIQEGHISATSYDKALTDILSTLAVYAAQDGLLD
ncbi:hypothetical protein B5G28_08585 [Faecalibacterium sp. An77]|uniref:hypothetical protein n=1 Tax=Faecalibacterium sp. An77 TaxID=1965655 RepID=UPI000B39F375|nr:hypothetical protein [Faecalibacterium sp. An77]OUN38640.1 hypothetical protein B5G28_08585 [Faecalibacterium sp. An77]